MSSQNYVNAADINIQHKRPENTSVNNDMKEKFIKYKSKELVFFSVKIIFLNFHYFQIENIGKTYKIQMIFLKKLVAYLMNLMIMNMIFPLKEMETKLFILIYLKNK